MTQRSYKIHSFNPMLTVHIPSKPNSTGHKFPWPQPQNQRGYLQFWKIFYYKKCLNKVGKVNTQELEAKPKFSGLVDRVRCLQTQHYTTWRKVVVYNQIAQHCHLT